MNLIKDKWSKEDIKPFQEYLKTFQREDKKEWTKNLLKTQMPCLAILSKDQGNIIKEIFKGNYLSFLDLMIWEYYENTSINGGLISRIKDFDLMKKYLDIYSSLSDNWATCDCLSFCNIKGNERRYLDLAHEYMKSDKPMVRRIGLESLFKLIDTKEYLDEIFSILNSFYDEEDYYVNMMNAWLLCDLFIKQREETLKFLKTHKLNKFTINKAISKCRDSFRVTASDKELLLNFKVK